MLARISSASREGALALLFVAPILPSQAAWKQTPAAPDAALQRAISLYRNQDFRRACPALSSLLSSQPSSPLLHLYLLGCAVRGRVESAVRRERDALHRLVPQGARAYSMAGAWLADSGYCAEAQEEFARATPPAEAGAFEFAVARCYQRRGEIELSVEQYRKAMALDADKEEYPLSLSFLLVAAGDSEGAGKVLVAAFQRHPQSVRILVTMSLLHLELGHPERARLGYEKARLLAPQSPMVWKLLGRIQISEGAYEEAVRSLEQAARIDPQDAQIPLFLGMALVRINAGRALAAFLRALELDPGLVEARFQAANIYFQARQDYQTAAGLLEKALEAAPGHVRARQLLAQCYYRLGRDQQAAEQLRKLREMSAPPAQRGGS